MLLILEKFSKGIKYKGEYVEFSVQTNRPVFRTLGFNSNYYFIQKHCLGSRGVLEDP